MIHQQTWMVIWLRQSGWEKFYVTLIIPWSQGKYFENVVALGPALLCCPSGPIRMKGLECCRMLRQGLRLKLWFLHFHCTQFWFPITILVHSRVADRTLKWTWTAMGRFEPFWTWESSIFFRLFTWFEYVVFTGHEVYKKTRIDPKNHEVWKPGMNHHRKFCPQMSRAYFHQATEIHSAFFLVPIDNRDVQRWCIIIYPDIPDISGVDSRPRESLWLDPSNAKLEKSRRDLDKGSWELLGSGDFLLAVDNLEFQDPAENRRWFFHGFSFQGLGRWSVVDSRRCHFWIEVKAGRITSKEDGFRSVGGVPF